MQFNLGKTLLLNLTSISHGYSMRSIISRFVLLFVLTMWSAFAFAQTADTCKGSLGDPVINQTFGAGSNPGPPLGSNLTNMNYDNNPCPEDGAYTIVNSVNAYHSCHTTWQQVLQDHTGDPNGYMMLINASEQPSIFYTQPAPGLCQNTTYEFSAYVLNLITLQASGPGVSEPNITFSIETTGGQVITTYNTGTIPATDLPTWNKYGVFFSLPAGVTDVVVKMINNAPGGNGNDLILDDIAFRACGPVIQSGFTTVGNNSPQGFCAGGSASYTLMASVGPGYDNPAYQWQINDNGNGWTDISGATTTTFPVSFTNAVAGTYQYRIAAASGSNITSPTCRTYSGVLTITIYPLPVVPAIPNQTVCETYTLTLTASGGASYSWSGPGISNSTQNPLVIPNVVPANAGTYSVVATSAQGCISPVVQTQVTVVPKVVAGVSGPVTICAGESTALSAATSTNALYYQWTPATGLSSATVQNPVATPTQTTTYSVTVSNDGCFDDSKSITVTVLNPPVANAGSNKVIFQGQSVKLNGSVMGDNIVKYYWTPADYLDDPNSLTPTANPPHDTTYTLNVISSTCGNSSASVFVRVYQKIVIPNTFSPNNDGINDLWDIGALVTYPESEILIFNRYGQQVYKSTGYSKAWDGTYNGTALPVGAYYYIIDLKNNTPKLSGWVAIIK